MAKITDRKIANRAIATTIKGAVPHIGAIFHILNLVVSIKSLQ